MRGRFAGAALILAAGMVVAACGSRSAQSGPRFASVTLTDDEASKTEKTVFAPDTPRIYVVFALADVPQGTVVKSVWVAEKTGVAEPNTKLDEATLTMGGAQNSGRFWYSRPTSGWPVGEYRVDLSIGERLAETRRFKIERQASSTSSAVPFASRGWTLEDGVYVNQRHGFRIAVPAGWTTGDEARFSERLLWVMARLNDAGQERLMTNITHTATGQASADEFFNSELESFKQTTYEDGGQTKPVFTVLETGTIGPDPALHYVRNTDQRRGLNLFSVRHGFGYIVVFQWVADATADELKELQAVARSMGYGDLPFATAGPGAPGAASPSAASPPAPSSAPAGVASGAPIVFATGVRNGQPVGAASTFAAGTRQIFAFVRYQGLRPEDRLDGIWFRDDREFTRQSTTVAEVFGSSAPPAGKLWFWVEWQQGAPAGSYRFELKFNGQATTQGTFEIR